MECRYARLLSRRIPLEQPFVIGGIAFGLALGVDLASKVLAIAYDVDGKVVVYNDRPGMLVLRIVMSLIAVAVAYLLTRGARHLGIGRLWGTWVGVGMLGGGVIGNGVSSLIWSRGVTGLHPHAGLRLESRRLRDLTRRHGRAALRRRRRARGVRARAAAPPPAHGLD